MKKILILISFVLSFVSVFGQLSPTPGTAPRSNSSVVPEDYNLSVRSSLFIPRFSDTAQANTNTKFDTLGRVIFTYDSMKLWVRVCCPKRWQIVGTGAGGGGSGSVTSFSAGNLSPLFTSNVATATTTPALTFSASNISQFQVLGRKASGSGAYSFLTADSSLITDLHSENYYNTKYSPIGSSGNTLSNVGTGPGWVKTLSAGNYPIKSPTAGFAISIATNTNDLGFSVDTTQLRDTLNVSNAGVGLNTLYFTTSSATNKTIWGKRLQAGANITLVTNSDSSITITGGAGTSYTFSTGLTLATTTVTNNLATGISGNQTLIGSTSNGSGLNIKATTGTGTSGADIRFLVGNAGADTALIVKNNKHVLINTSADAGAQLSVVGPVKLLTSVDAHVWDLYRLDSSLQLTVLHPVNGKVLAAQGDSLAWITGGLTNLNLGSGVWNSIAGTNSFKAFVSTTGTITYDTSGSNIVDLRGTLINNNAVNRVITGSNTANTLNANSSFTWNNVDEVKFTTSSSFYWTAVVGGNTNFIYMPNTDMQVYPNNTLAASFNGTANKTLFQGEGSIGFKSTTASTTDLQMDNTKTTYVFNGSTQKTWFLPTIATANNDRWYYVKNIGSAVLTVADQGSASTIYTTAAFVSVNIAPGQEYAFRSNGTYWTARAGSIGGAYALWTNRTSFNNSGSGETDLHSYTVLGNQLFNDGDYIEGTMVFQKAANTNSVTIKFKFGATVITFPAFVDAGSSVVFNFKIIRDDATTQRIELTASRDNGTLQGTGTYFTTASETLSGNVTLKATGQGSSSADISQVITTLTYWHRGDLFVP